MVIFIFQSENRPKSTRCCFFCVCQTISEKRIVEILIDCQCHGLARSWTTSGGLRFIKLAAPSDQKWFWIFSLKGAYWAIQGSKAYACAARYISLSSKSFTTLWAQWLLLKLLRRLPGSWNSGWSLLYMLLATPLSCVCAALSIKKYRVSDWP